MIEKVRVPPKLKPVFNVPRGDVQHRGAYGGRGSGKSYTFAQAAAVWGAVWPMRVLCAREWQTSIKESFHAELRAAITAIPWLDSQYDIGTDYLRGSNGTEFIFRGLRRNTQSIKSLAKIDLTIVEEAEDVPEEAWLALEATIFRQPKSELWAIWNPRVDGSPVDKRLRKSPPPDSCIVEINHDDNPWFPENLEKLRRREQARLDPSTYAHIWEGAYLENSDSQVLAGKVKIVEFKHQEEWQGPYYGADWGFSQDPTAAIRAWIHDECLYIDHEAGKTGLEIDETAHYLTAGIPDIERHTLRSDSARPETISYVKRHGLPRCVGVDKWKGSVEDGIAHLRSYRAIVVHPRCREFIKESRLYSYKVDKNTGDILPVLIDANNHYIDALRYALAPMIKRRNATMMGLKVAGL